MNVDTQKHLNMKKSMMLLALCFLLGTALSLGVNFLINKETGKILSSGVVTVYGKSKDDFYMSAREWFMNYFRSSNDVIQIDDKENGIFASKGQFDVHLCMMS